jgi:hypothetical protein
LKLIANNLAIANLNQAAPNVIAGIQGSAIDVLLLIAVLRKVTKVHVATLVTPGIKHVGQE